MDSSDKKVHSEVNTSSEVMLLEARRLAPDYGFAATI